MDKRYLFIWVDSIKIDNSAIKAGMTKNDGSSPLDWVEPDNFEVIEIHKTIGQARSRAELIIRLGLDYYNQVVIETQFLIDEDWIELDYEYI